MALTTHAPGDHDGDLATGDPHLADLLRLANLTDDILLVSDADGCITYANAAAARAHGDFARVGQQLTDFIHEEDAGYPHLLKAMVARDGRAEARVMAKRGDGSPMMMDVRTVYDAETRRWFTVERDISQTIEDERRMAELTADLRRQAMTDPLTGVANRHALNEQLELAIAEERPFAVMILDIDDFESVNERYGRDTGDELLRRVAYRLGRAVKNTDVVARFGDDEFAVYLPGVTREFAANIAPRIVGAICGEFEVGGVQLTSSGSIGVAVHEDGEDAHGVLRRADRAMGQAKTGGPCTFEIA